MELTIFRRTQADYEKHTAELFKSLDRIDIFLVRLEGLTYVFGEQMTEIDIIMFSSITHPIRRSLPTTRFSKLT